MKKIAGLLFLASIPMLFCGTASAALITSNADPALTGSTLIDFNSTLSQDTSSLTYGDVVFSTSSVPFTVASWDYGGGYGIDGQSLHTVNGTNSFSISFGSTVSAFGMSWGAANPNWDVKLFDSSNNLLESLVFIGGDNGASFYEFYGATNSGIARADFFAQDYDWVVIDDFRYVTDGQVGDPVPEPATMLLLGSGLAGLAAARRRKKVS
jgi:hypothetical protein